MQKIYIILLGVLLLQACIKKDDVLPPVSKDTRPLAAVLQNNYTYAMFYTAVERAGLDQVITGDSLYTLLVPDNSVFASAGITPDSLQHMDIAVLKKLISYHILPGAVTMATVPQTIDYPFKSIAGPNVYFSVPVKNGAIPALHINGATVKKADIIAGNGVIHAIDRVLEYPAATVKEYLVRTPRFSLYTQALKQFGLLEGLTAPGPFVVLAPTNKAFLQRGYDSAAIAAMDTLHYKKWLFGAAIMKTGFFFKTDFKDAPLPNDAPVYVTPDCLMVFRSDKIGLALFDYIHIINNYTPPYYGNPFVYGDMVTLDDPDHPALNGVVHGTNKLLALPDSLIIK
ncbi:putative surface protein with fasciclin (FAS1) repeats [Chitinophaga niastensis]|uniref:Putative surface protein with fasciclin (FAS1) repeats n=1 Tax=Chitinophaga niastensis TaxID=536980 RepID=A0A2P8HP35_CHINA|nr:fasciclin domain-containing protein [Chitinophaga niastensis]PSL47968.1 putative surface protein with fasciclin (FAS1) repeats [Chitinophaga niastensis]